MHLISGHKEELDQKDHQVYRNFLLAVSYEQDIMQSFLQTLQPKHLSASNSLTWNW